MKIALVHGQNHKGSTYRMGRMLAEKLDKDAQIAEFFLPRDLNGFCSGCCACLQDETRCPYFAEKTRINDALERADVLIFTTPCYCLAPSAPMKAFVDLTFLSWMSHRPKQCMFTKRAAVLSTAAGMGAGRAAKEIARTLFYWGVPYRKAYGMAIQATSLETMADKKKRKLERDLQRLANALRRKAAPKPSLYMRLMFFGMRMMQKAGAGACPEDRAYWQKNGWLEHKRPWKQAA